jgi:hypothetical protein
MNNWLILAIAVVIAAIGYYMLRKKTVKEPGTLAAVEIAPAPGVQATTGTVAPNPPLPPPKESMAVGPSGTNSLERNVGLSSVFSGQHLGTAYAPTDYSGKSRTSMAATAASLALGVASPALLQHVPIVGNTAARAVRTVGRVGIGAATGTLNASANILSQVPLVGGLAAAPVKVASKAISAVSNFFGF